MKKTTVGELGCNLPIGLMRDGQLLKRFELQPFKTKTERMLGAWQKSNAHLDEGQILTSKVSKLLSMLVINVDAEGMPKDPLQAERSMYSWWADDVMYAYVVARIQALGNEFVWSFSCNKHGCKYSTDSAVFDLNTLEVSCLETPDELRQSINLKHPFMLSSGEKLHRVTVSPLRWSSFTRGGAMLDAAVGAGDFWTFRDSICGINGREGSVVLTDDDIDEFSFEDYRRIEKITQDNSAGISLQTHADCPDCGTTNYNILNWGYDDFFGSSSLLVK